MKRLMIAIALAGAFGLAASATPAAAGVVTGATAPSVDSNKMDVQRRCWHRRWSSRWRCHYVGYRPYYYAHPYYYPRPFFAPHPFYYRPYRRWWW